MQAATERKDRRKKFIAVIGERNSGKSTIIVSLTGCPNRSFRDKVTDDSNKESIYVIASSPQEKRLDENQEADIKPFQNILDEVIKDGCCRGLVMAIQPIKPQARWKLSLEDIVREVQSRNAFESYLFVLDPSRNDARPILDEVNRRLEAASFAQAQELNGRRFAFLNARDINQASQMFG